MSTSSSLIQLASLASECSTHEEYEGARTAWLEAHVPCDTIYFGPAAEDGPVRPVVTRVDPAYTEACEAKRDRYAADLAHLDGVAMASGGVAVDVERLSAKDRRARPFYREVVAGLGLQTVGIAVPRLRGRRVASVYFGYTRHSERALAALRRLIGALPVLALGEAAHARQGEEPSASGDLGLSRRERQIAAYASRGLTNREIGAIVGTAPTTVKNQIAAILRKVGAANRTELAWLLSTGAVDAPPSSRH